MPIQLSIVTPERVLLERDDAEFVLMPGEMGDLGILPSHAPLLSALKTGQVQVRFRNKPKSRRIAVSGGFAHVLPDKVTITAEAAEFAEEISVTRAEAARERAEQRLQAKAEELDVARAKAAFARALNRLSVARAAAPASPDPQGIEP